MLATFNTALHLYTRSDIERLSRASSRAPVARAVEFVAGPVDPLLRWATWRAPLPVAPTTRRAFVIPPRAAHAVRNREYFDYDPWRQVLFVSMEFEPVGDPGRAWMTPLAHRQFFPQEWGMLLHYNGFAVERVEGDFCGGPVTRDSDVMVWHARRRGAGRR